MINKQNIPRPCSTWQGRDGAFPFFPKGEKSLLPFEKRGSENIKNERAWIL